MDDGGWVVVAGGEVDLADFGGVEGFVRFLGKLRPFLKKCRVW